MLPRWHVRCDAWVIERRRDRQGIRLEGDADPNLNGRSASETFWVL
jgi:hypothetical protein